MVEHSCTHRTTARSAKDANVWKCLHCGDVVPVELAPQLVLTPDGVGDRKILPKPPERR